MGVTVALLESAVDACVLFVRGSKKNIRSAHCPLLPLTFALGIGTNAVVVHANSVIIQTAISAHRRKARRVSGAYCNHPLFHPPYITRVDGDIHEDSRSLGVVHRTPGDDEKRLAANRPVERYVLKQHSSINAER